MFAVIFEVEPKPERREDYLALAQRLRPALEAIDGFLEVERFAASGAPGRLLSLSFWRDEKAVVRWRSHGEHHAVQAKGRAEIFRDYRLRVGEVVADSGLPIGNLVEQRFDETQAGAAKWATVTELGASVEAPASALDAVTFESLYTPGKRLLLASWADAAAAAGWSPPAATRHRRIRIIRDYGMLDRREAPQFHPPV
jgi:heme-degrading monooxygenase HmoA